MYYISPVYLLYSPWISTIYLLYMYCISPVSLLYIYLLYKPPKYFLCPGGAEDDEPDKIAIAIGRFGRFKRFIKSSVKNFFLFFKNKIVELVTGRRGRWKRSR